MRPLLTVNEAIALVNMLIVPLFTYCCTLKPVFNKLQTYRIKFFEQCAKETITANEQLTCKIDILNSGKLKVCKLVIDVLLGNGKPPLNINFTISNTSANTRNKNLFVRILNVRLEYRRRSLK